MSKDFQAAAPPPAQAPVIVRRAAFAELTAMAEKVAENSAAASQLVDLVRAIEADRYATEWDEEDAKFAIGRYVGDERGYFYGWAITPEGRHKPGILKWKVLWQDGEQELVVRDQPPIPADRITRLETLGIARPQPTHLPGTPFRFLHVSNPDYESAIRDPSLSVESPAGPPGGSWIVAGPDRKRVAWVKHSSDARYMASSVNMAIELDHDVARYGGGHRYDFPDQIQKSGLRGLIHLLRQSIEPHERWETEPPETVRTAGAELERALVAFLDASQSHRFVKLQDRDPEPPT